MAWNPATLSGTFKDSKGVATSINGYAHFALSQDGTSTSGGFAIASASDVAFAVTAGVIAGGSQITTNDDIVPAGTYYRLILITTDGSIVARRNVTLSPAGAAIDVGTLTIPSTPFSAGAGVPSTRLINTTSPITGGGDLTADRTIGIPTPLPIVNGGTNNSSVYPAGGVVYSTGSLLTNDSTNFFYDSTNKRIGVGTASPAVAIDTTGSLAIREATTIVLANGANNDVALVANTGHVRFTGGGASATITGLLAGANGQNITIVNNTGSAISVFNDSGSSAAANRLYVLGGNSGLSLSMADKTSLTLIYNTTLSHWVANGLITLIGGVNSQTISYAALASDDRKIISMNGVSLTLTLPATPPTATWGIFVENLAATSLTVARNGATIDGAASNLTLAQNTGTYISTDNFNYFTSRGITGNAPTVTIVDDTATNATMFPTWVTANTGSLPEKVSSTKFTFNPSTGSLVSTVFTGPVTALKSATTSVDVSAATAPALNQALVATASTTATWQYPALFYSEVADSTTISNTVTPTAYSKSFAIPANTLQVGSVIEIDYAGVLSTDVGGSTFLWAPRIGAVTIVTFATSGLIISNTNTQFSNVWGPIKVIVRSIGAGGTGYTTLNLMDTIKSDTTNPAIAFGYGSGNTTIALNTTGTLTVDLMVTMGTATAGNTTTLKYLGVKIFNPGSTS